MSDKTKYALFNKIKYFNLNNMIIIKIEKNISIEKALKLYKSKIIKTRQQSELNNRKYFIKKSAFFY